MRLAAGLVLAATLTFTAWAKPPPAAAHTAVIHPPAHVDPAMPIKPVPRAHLPTPVIHPPIQHGNTLIVPK